MKKLLAICILGLFCGLGMALEGYWEIPIERQPRTILVMRYIKNPAHAISFIAICDYLKMSIPIGLAICNRESSFKQYAWAEKTNPKTKKKYVSARGYMMAAPATTKLVMSKTPGMKYQGIPDEYDAANNFYVCLIHAKYYIDRFGTRTGLEIYNVGEGNYFGKDRWRNSKYVNDVLSDVYKYKEELESIPVTNLVLTGPIEHVYDW